MNETIREYYEIIVLAGIGVILLFNLIIIRYNSFFSKYFANQKFRVKSVYEIESLENKQHFTLNIFNNNLNDTRVVAFGFTHSNQTIDYYKYYLNHKHNNTDNGVVIQSRASIKVHIPIHELKDILQHHNKGRKKIKRLDSFVIDSQGLTTKLKAKAIRNIINTMLREERKAFKAKKKEALKKQKAQHKQKRKEKRLNNKDIRKEKRARLFMKLKNIRFKKKE